MADGGDIIIRGGSVDLDYDDSVYSGTVDNEPPEHARARSRSSCPARPVMGSCWLRGR